MATQRLVVSKSYLEFFARLVRGSPRTGRGPGSATSCGYGNIDVAVTG